MQCAFDGNAGDVDGRELPIADRDQRTMEGTMNMSDTGSVGPASGIYPIRQRLARVILGEDDDEMRAVLAEELRRDGYEVLEAKDGTEMELRLKSVRHCPLKAPDVIVMDIRMPGHSGLEILKAVRQAQWTTPVMLITGFPDASLLADARDLDAEVFGKPFDVDALREAVHAYREAPQTRAAV